MNWLLIAFAVGVVVMLILQEIRIRALMQAESATMEALIKLVKDLRTAFRKVEEDMTLLEEASEDTRRHAGLPSMQRESGKPSLH